MPTSWKYGSFRLRHHLSLYESLTILYYYRIPRLRDGCGNKNHLRPSRNATQATEYYTSMVVEIHRSTFHKFPGSSVASTIIKPPSIAGIYSSSQCSTSSSIGGTRDTALSTPC